MHNVIFTRKYRLFHAHEVLFSLALEKLGPTRKDREVFVVYEFSTSLMDLTRVKLWANLP